MTTQRKLPPPSSLQRYFTLPSSVGWINLDADSSPTEELLEPTIGHTGSFHLSAQISDQELSRAADVPGEWAAAKDASAAQASAPRPWRWSVTVKPFFWPDAAQTELKALPKCGDCKAAGSNAPSAPGPRTAAPRPLSTA